MKIKNISLERKKYLSKIKKTKNICIYYPNAYFNRISCYMGDFSKCKYY